MHSAEPFSLACFPGAHEKQSAEEELANVPTLQSTHKDAVGAPILLLALPGGHSLQALASFAPIAVE